jgi:hypothetical protein
MSATATPPAPDEAHDLVRDRVQMPAMFLVANGSLNLLVALFVSGYAVKEAMTTPEAVRDSWAAQLRAMEKGGTELPEALRRSLDEARDDPARFKRQRVAGDAVAGVVLLLGGILGVLGGVRMYRARSYALAMVGSLASLVPCLTPTSYCCMGELIGLWCAWVLLLPGVRAGFR